jgi:peroxiredoxin
MRLKPETHAPSFDVIDYNGEEIAFSEYKGTKLFLSFFRYAACPFCNLRVHKMIKEYPKFEKKGLEFLAVFQSPSASIQEYVGKQEPPFPIVGDPGMQLYKQYGVEISYWSFTKMLFRFKDLFNSNKKGFFNLYPEGPIARVPADFLINENGIIDIAYYGKDSGDHIPFKLVESWLSKE